MNKNLICIFLCIFLYACNSQIPEEPVNKKVFVQEFQKGPLDISISIRPEKPSIADRIDLEIAVAVDSKYTISMPDFGNQIGQMFFVYDYYKEPVKMENRKKIYRQFYEIEALISGNITFAPIRFKYQQGDEITESAFTVQTDGFTIEIGALALQDEDMQDIYDIHSVINLQRSWFKEIVGASIVVLLLFVFVVAKWLYKPKQQEYKYVDTRTPEEIAWEKLHELIEKNYMDTKQYQHFYFELTMIVRRYIEIKYSLNAPGQTTEEFMQNMNKSSIFNPEQQNKFAQFLAATDFVKYAAQEPEVKEVEAVFDTAKKFMNLE